MSILVEKPGSLTLIEDMGRPGHAHLAVPRSGAADRPACIRANRLVGNADGDAALEMTLLGAHVRFESDTVVALAGADMDARLDGAPLPPEVAVAVRAGQRLACHAARNGVRTYLAVAGGIDAPQAFGSRSYDVLSQIGPPPLRAGDRLRIGELRGPARPVPPPPAVGPGVPAVRFLPGPRDDWFVPAALQALTSGDYVVSPDSNRIAVRLRGAVLERAVTRELPSEGLVPGAIEVPPDGLPVVMLADHPTTGGYPVIGVVVAEDLWVLAQAAPGTRLRFVS